MNKDEPPPESYYDNYAVAYRIYKDAGIARDIARLVKPKEKPNVDEPKRTT
jgi:hypothetical protein